MSFSVNAGESEKINSVNNLSAYWPWQSVSCVIFLLTSINIRKSGGIGGLTRFAVHLRHNKATFTFLPFLKSPRQFYGNVAKSQLIFHRISVSIFNPTIKSPLPFIKESHRKRFFIYTDKSADKRAMSREQKFLQSTCAKNLVSFKNFCLRLSSRVRLLDVCKWLLWVLRKIIFSSLM